MTLNTRLRGCIRPLIGALLMTGFAFTVLVHRQTAIASSASPHYRFRNAVIGGGGGFVPGIIFSPRKPNLIYARTDIGGAYRWNPRSCQWIPLLDWIGWNDWNLPGVESIAADPIDPDRVYFAVGTYTNEW